MYTSLKIYYNYYLGMDKIPRYLYPIEDELPIPYYFSRLELGLEEEKKKRKARKTRKNRSKRIIKTHTKRIR
jgi:hypothetical protein